MVDKNISISNIECGLSSFYRNVRIVGGVTANPFSWPSQVLIYQDYKINYTFPDKISKVFTRGYYCGGTLINRYTVLTSAYCITSSFNTTYKNVTYEIKIKPNQYYPTTASMFTVFLAYIIFHQ